MRRPHPDSLPFPRAARRTLAFTVLLLSGCAPEGQTQANGNASEASEAPAQPAAPALTQAMLDATPASLGAEYEMREGRVVVTRVLPGSPADEGGLEVGDVVVTIENADIEALADVQRRVDEYAFDNRALVGVERDGRTETLRVPLTVDLAAAPSRALPGTLPTGEYSCLHVYYDFMNKRTMSDPVGELTILSGDRYRWFEGDPGRFDYDPATGAVAFEGGVWAEAGAAGELAWLEDADDLVLRIVFQVDEENDLTYRCHPPE